MYLGTVGNKGGAVKSKKKLVQVNSKRLRRERETLRECECWSGMVWGSGLSHAMRGEAKVNADLKRQGEYGINFEASL